MATVGSVPQSPPSGHCGTKTSVPTEIAAGDLVERLADQRAVAPVHLGRHAVARAREDLDGRRMAEPLQALDHALRALGVEDRIAAAV